jgi:small subunit ribosomal protein S16
MWSSQNPNIYPALRLTGRGGTPFFFAFTQLRRLSLIPAFLIMALKIRLQRHGASHRPFYRMVVTEALARRDGRFVEVLGTYEPQAKRSEDELSVKLDRVDYWKSVGAKPTDTAASLIRKARREAPAEASAEA